MIRLLSIAGFNSSDDITAKSDDTTGDTVITIAAAQSIAIENTLIAALDGDDKIWLVSFIDYDLGYFDSETCTLEPLANPVGPKVLPMSPV